MRKQDMKQKVELYVTKEMNLMDDIDGKPHLSRQRQSKPKMLLDGSC